MGVFGRRVKFLFFGMLLSRMLFLGIAFLRYVFLKAFSRWIEFLGIFYTFMKIPIAKGGDGG